MTSKYKPYPAYKPSGVAWLGDVPKHWEVKRLKYVSTINDEVLLETTPSDFEIKYVDISSVDYIKGIIKKEVLTFDEAPSRARRIVRDGDTILSTVRTYLRAIAPIKKPEANLIVSTGFAVVRPRKLEPRYLAFCLQSPYFIETVVSRSTGVSYPAINSSELGKIEVPIPRVEEQKAIADFLDRETAKIDDLIAKKQRFIDLLKEKRTALISRAVTKGLNSNVKLKPSGIPWLGDVPQHWEVKKLKFLVKLQSQKTETQVNPIALENIESWTGRLIDSRAEFDSGGIVYQKGDILFGKLRPYLAKVYLAEVSGEAVGDLFVMKSVSGCLPNYLAYLLRTEAFIDIVNSATYGSKMPRVSWNYMSSLLIALPPEDEQRKITCFIDREISNLDNLTCKVESVIEKLKEYRQSLIYGAVTGQMSTRK